MVDVEKIPYGYQHTEVGTVPSDWDLKTFGEVFDFLSTATYSKAELTDNDDVRYVHYGDIHTQWNFFLDFNKCSLPTITSNQTKNYSIIKDGDLIMADASEDYEGIGKCVEVKNIGSCKAISGLHTFLMRDKNNHLAPNFKGYLYKNPLVKKQFDRLATGLKVYGVSKTNLKTVLIPFPVKESEQIAIATALSDTDVLIDNLEKLIAKKQNIKQVIIHSLLNPKVDWENKYLPEVCWFQEGPGLRNWQFTSAGIKVINVTNLENGVLNLERTARYISLEEFHKMYEHFEIDENDIVVASSGNSYGKVAVVRKDDLPLVMNTSVIRFKPLKQLDYNYLFIFLKSYLFKKQVDVLITGGAQPNFGPAHLNQVLIPIPPSKKEQIEISTIIFDMDTEIVALEQKLHKYKMLKKSMMQVLLTGKIRIL